MSAAATCFGPGQDRGWGSVRELVVNQSLLLRWIELRPGGRSSVHRHAGVEERILVVGGEVTISLGEDPSSLQELKLGPADLIAVPSGTWHAGACRGEGRALVVELVIGAHQEGKVAYERAGPSVPAPQAQQD